MPAYTQRNYCPKCQKQIESKAEICPTCGESLKSGDWVVRFYIIDFYGTKRKRLGGFKTKKEAHQAYLDFMKDYKPLQKDLSKVTTKIEDAWAQYMNFCETDNSASTLYDKKHIAEKYILPYFKGYDVKELTKNVLLVWQSELWKLKKNEKTGEPFSWKYLTKIRGTLYNFLYYCESYLDIPNMFRYIRTPKNKEERKEMRFWELSTFNKFINTIDDILWKTIYMTFFYTGVRFNELRALRDSDIQDNIIKVHASMVHRSVNKTRTARKATKTYRNLTKKIPRILAEQIKTYKSWKLQNGISGDFLFGGDEPIPERNYQHHLAADIKRAKVSPLNIHGFRHSYVSMLINIGTPTKVVAELVGDREEQILKTYGHLYSNAKDDAINRLDESLEELG